MAETLLTRSLTSKASGGLRVIEALRWPTPFGGGFRVYLGADTQQQIAVPQNSGLSLGRKQQIGSNVVLNGTAQTGGQGGLTLQIGDVPFDIETSGPESDLFDTSDVLLAQRHGETAEEVADWLAYHVADHKARALLIVDRAPPQDGFVEALVAKADLAELDQALLVSAPIPLGARNRPALFDRAFAPRAKERHAKVDPWRAPLGELALFDILRWRFLARAGAVIALDPTEYLRPPEDGFNAFDAVRQSHTGVMPILGTPIYPWRIRKGVRATRHDHICRAETAKALPAKWGVAAKRVGPGMIWMQNSVANAPVVPDESLSYQKAMAMAFPQVDVAELVNKDILVRDTALFDAAIAAGAKPIEPPSRPKSAPKVQTPPPSGRTVIVTCMKNEGPFILEWVAYHRMIGVDDILVYTNDCDDGTVMLLDLLAARGFLQRRDNPFRETGAKPQQSALDAAGSEPVIRNAGWIISMDVDEFINIHVGSNRLPDLYAAVGDASLISLTWRLFGNNDIAAYQDRPITDQFIRCAPHLIRRPHQAWGFKTLFRNQGLFKGMGVHRPRGHLGAKALWVNGSGQAMPDRLFKTGWRSDLSTYGYDLATLNHYSVRSAESFLVKRDRGRVNHVARDQGEAYWFRMNNNDEQDLSIQVHAQALRDALAELQSDPEIKAAHDRSVAKHRDKIAVLLKDPDFARLYRTLTSERMRKLSRMLRHFGMNVFLSGPAVIPDKVFDPNLPANFLFNVAPPQGPAAE